MKLKVLLIVVFAAGLAASIAVADNGNRGGNGKDGSGCQQPVRLSGTAGPQTLTLTVTHARPDGTVTVEKTVTVTIGAAGQIVQADISACSSGGPTPSFTVRNAELRGLTPETTTGATTSGKNDDNDEGQGDTDQGGHHHTTETSTTTTAQTTTTTHS